MKVKFLILGAGPSGLCFAESLLRNGESDFVLLEKENEAGGLCRSKNVDGAPLDIGGGHFLDVRRPLVCELLFSFMPQDEWRQYERDSRIRFDEYELHHPFEANIWELPEDKQKLFLDSIAKAGCNTDKEIPDKFVDWIYWKLGDAIADTYMLPYNRKMFGDNLNELGIYWLDKLPNTSYEETLRSCRERRAFGTQPGHAKFFYPVKYGYGEVWKRIGDNLGDKLCLNEPVKTIDFEKREVLLDGGRTVSADYIVVTVPWKSMTFLGAPESVKGAVSQLIHTSIEVTYHPEDMDTDAQWIYYPDEKLDYHRILVRKNFYEGAKGYWTETRTERFKGEGFNESFHMEYAYPVNTLAKPQAMRKILDFAERHNVFGLGRWGEHSHYNSDAAVERAVRLAEKLTF